MAKKKFDQIWKNQTELGKKFGISAIAVGKILIEHGLKDQETKQATQRALDEEYAKSTPLKDGTPYFMWNVQKVKQIIAQDHTQLNIVDYWVNEVSKNLKKAEQLSKSGEDKLAIISADGAYDEVPANILDEVKAKIEIPEN